MYYHLMNEEISKPNLLDYTEQFNAFAQRLSWREQQLLRPLELSSTQEAHKIAEDLIEQGFVLCSPSKVQMGEDKGLPCKLEGSRANETPIREISNIPSFYVSKCTVTNEEFEQFDPGHKRPSTSPGDRHPVTCLTYGKAISYCMWLNKRSGLNFRLPTEPEYVAFAAPELWKYPYQQDGKPIKGKQNSFKAFDKEYGDEGGTLPVDSTEVPTNHLGLHHATGNVSIFALGHTRNPGGQWGSATDGAYSIALGGGFRQCDYGGRVVTRGLFDVTAIVDTVGIRLVHPNPLCFIDA